MALVLPRAVDDPGQPSGGNVYALELARALAEDGVVVERHLLAAGWPFPGDDTGPALEACLRDLPDGRSVLIDGLLALGAPEALHPHRHRLRLVVLVHLPLTMVVPGDPATAAAERAALTAAAAVVTTSHWTRRRLIAEHGLPGTRVHVALPGSRPAPRTRPSSGGDRLLCLGAVVPGKGQDVLVEALAGLGDLDWSCRFTGPLDRDAAFVAGVRARIDEVGLADRIRLTGPRPASRIGEHLAGADLVVLPTRMETYGMSLTEALARGVPVIASRVGGVAEAVGRDDAGRVPGVLLPAGDADALRTAIAEWLTEPHRRDRLRSRAAERRSSLPRWADTAAAIRTATDGARLNRSDARSVVRT